MAEGQPSLILITVGSEDCPSAFINNQSGLSLSVAEGLGFEPRNRFYPVTRFPGVPVRPLRHPSNELNLGVICGLCGEIERIPEAKASIQSQELRSSRSIDDSIDHPE